MSQCVLCGKEYEEKPQTGDKTIRLVRIWWDTNVWICNTCWGNHRIDAMLAPIRFLMEYNGVQYGEHLKWP